MKKLIKTIAMILSLVMVMSCCGLGVAAEKETVKANDYPFVLVHGLGGWGQYDAATCGIETSL